MGIEDGLDYDDLKQAVHDVDRFLCDIEHALERHGLKEQVLRWSGNTTCPARLGADVLAVNGAGRP